MSTVPRLEPKKLKVAIVAPSLRYVGGQAVQADLLMNLWMLFCVLVLLRIRRTKLKIDIDL